MSNLNEFINQLEFKFCGKPKSRKLINKEPLSC